MTSLAFKLLLKLKPSPKHRNRQELPKPPKKLPEQQKPPKMKSESSRDLSWRTSELRQKGKQRRKPKLASALR